VTTGLPNVYLGQSGHREARKPLERLLKEGSVELRRAAADALTTLAMPESADALLRQIEQEREGTVRIPLAAAAEKLRLTQSVEPMISWLSDPSQEVRSAAHHALTLITGQQFGPDVQQWNGWWATRK
jgi:HEAT repeat protein